MILVISYPGEEHTDDVQRRLERAGQDVVRLDLSDFPAARGLSLAWEPGSPDAYRVETPQGQVDLAQVQAGWWRRVRAHQPDPGLSGPNALAFAVSETNEAVSGMLDALGCPWMNPREADAAAHHKPLQWAAARQVGLTLPRTLVTTRPDDARAFIGELGVGRVVFKAFIAMLEAWRETRLVQPDDLEHLDTVRLAPVIFQEYVPGVDLRIIAVGDQLYTAELDAQDTSYPVDMRMVIGEAKVRPAELPRELERRLLALQRRLGLVYGAIDMRRTPDGEYVFFEVNPAGQWMFVEERTGLPISQAVADQLIAMTAQPATGQPPATAPAREAALR